MERIRSIGGKIKSQWHEHRIRSIVLLLVIVGISWYAYGKVSASNASALSFTTGTVTRGTIVATVTATGQVASSNEVELAAKTTGTITSVPVKTGQKVGAGALIASVNSTDSYYALQSAQISHEQLLQSADASDIESAKDSIAKSYVDLWNSTANIFTNFPAVSASLNDLYYTKTGFLSGSAGYDDRNSLALNYINEATKSFNKALDKYQTVQKTYTSLNAKSDEARLDKLVADTEDMVRLMSQAIKDAQTSITYIQTIQSEKNKTASQTAATSVNSLASQVNGYISDTVTSQNEITSARKTLADLLKGPDALDVESSKLSLSEKQVAYADNFIRAPFGGIVAKVNVKKSDPINSGTIVATLVTESKVANLSLNEVDAAKVKQGSKATLTFDAIEDLSITGTVVTIDEVGTVSSGVVNYGVQITFDTNDERVKSGMSVSAAIQTDIAQDVLTVPSSAVKTQNGASYVQTLQNENPVNIPVEVGITDDTNTEIKSGLEEGASIIVRTTGGSKTTVTSSAPSILGGGSATRGATGSTRTFVSR